MPRLRPNTRWERAVKRFVREYPRITIRARGDRRKQTRLSCAAAPIKIAALMAVRRKVPRRLTRPAGKARSAVRGLRASNGASARRLKAMAAERAPIMASKIKPVVRPLGRPRAASMAPIKAKGRARTLWPILIISSNSQIFRKTRCIKILKRSPQRKSSDQWSVVREPPAFTGH